MKKGIAAGCILAAAVLAAFFFLIGEGRGFLSRNATDPGAYETIAPPSPDTGEAGASGGKLPSQQEAPLFEIFPDRQKLIGLKTVAVMKRPMIKTIRTVGRIEYDERKLTTVNIKYEGWVERLHADYSGKYVRKGEPLAEIYSPEATSTQLEYLNLMKWKNQVPRFQRTIEFEWGDRYGTTGRFVTYDPELLVEVAKQKLRLWGFTEKDIARLEKSKDAFRTITIRSPVSGYVFEKPTFRGTRVNPGDKLFDIVDLSMVWVLADVYEYELRYMREGQPATVSLSNYPDKAFDVKVDFVYPSLSGNTRTVKVRFVIPNPDGILKPQMFADVLMRLDLGERLAVPRDAVFDTGLRKVVYVDAGDNFFQARRVKLGARADTFVEVVDGLKPGERIVARPVFLVDSEAKLKGCGD
ncbi:MAG TPA: efflux RND transporter periplasmic adaptor subunit [Deltaproteobacteria bacterium]|nr:efflux RND transporter periplasmic adaptor subunit [Deltaproteobacteria bacterium]HQJ08902.1 efflux RND transporter periplasmic adaptor subunit [Deltaproteobacteria bacterium]